MRKVACRLQRIDTKATSKQDIAQAGQGCTKVITAIGYTRNQLPEILAKSWRLQDAELFFIHQIGMQAAAH